MEKTLEFYKNYEIAESPLHVEKIHILEGANYFSAGPVVLIRLDLAAYDEVFSNQIEAFAEKLEALMPSLHEHHCSVGKPGGFLLRVKEGTLLGHVIEHVAIELQTLAGMDVGYGKTRSTLKQGVYNIIFRFFDDIAGLYAGKAAVNLVSSILNNTPFDVNEIISALIDIREMRLPGPSTQAILDVAEKRNIPCIRLDSYNLVQLGTGRYQKRIRATITSDTNFIAVETADNKYLTNLILKDAGIPVPEAIRTNETAEVIAFAKNTGKSLVIKPCEGSRGSMLALNIKTPEDIAKACAPILDAGETILAQPYIKGNSYRLLVIDFKFVAASLLSPPSVTGNDVDTIGQLIEMLNNNPDRQYGDKGKLSNVEIDEDTLHILHYAGFSIDSVLTEGETIYLKNSGNLRLGGSSKDVTDSVDPFTIFVAERAARVIGLNVAGIDIISEDISVPLNQNNGVVIEMNAAPDFRIHIKPYIGNSRNVAENMMDMLFPQGAKTRVPLISVTGSTGKTSTVCFIDYCLRQEGNITGLATTEGMFINNKKLIEGDMSYPQHVALVLKDPTIDIAILETSREGILRKGLGYKYADIGVFLNIFDEHVGDDDIKYIEDLVYAKSVVAEQVYETGYSVLNADYELIMEVLPRLYSKPVLFSADVNNQLLKNAVAKGQTVVYIENGNIVTNHRSIKQIIAPIADMPLVSEYSGKVNYDSLLASVAVLVISGIGPEKIAQYLTEYIG